MKPCGELSKSMNHSRLGRKKTGQERIPARKSMNFQKSDNESSY